MYLRVSLVSQDGCGWDSDGSGWGRCCVVGCDLQPSVGQAVRDGAPLFSPVRGQVPQDEWSGFSPLGNKEDDIPCRRMRSGSYVKAMAEDDSGDSDGSPKPSPKVQARRASYLKATQPSLTEMTTLQ